jgi:hypothetical protein
MLQMRARGFASRDAFPDSLKGFITVEEAKDIKTHVQPEAIKQDCLDIEKLLKYAESKGLKLSDLEHIADKYSDSIGITTALQDLPATDQVREFFTQGIKELVDLKAGA